MTLEQFLIKLVRQWRLVVTCVVVVGVGAFIASRLITPLYQSSVLVQVAFSSSANQSDYYSFLTSEQLVQTEMTLATSDPVLRAVASHYPGLTPDVLSGEVTVTPKANTPLFQIDVRDPSPARAAALANDIVNTLIQQQIQMGQQASAVSNNFLVVVQPARPALKPVIPNTRLTVAAGLLAGLLLGMSLALLFEHFDPRVRTLEALTQLLGWPILALISQAEPKEDVINPTGNNANVEPYRILRTNIGFSALENPLRTLLVTSAAPRDGRSVIAANLAIFMARAGKSTLLVDADMRHPTQHEQFGLAAHTMGFSNAILVLSMPATANAPAYQQPSPPSSTPGVTRTPSLDPFIHATNIPNLCVMPSGPQPPNPPELLDSKAMQHLLTALGGYGFEAVIFDTPPLLGLSDASILASKTDGTLVVVDINRATKEQLKQLKAILEQAGANILGVVVNKQPPGLNHASYYTAHKQNGRRSHSKKGANPAAISPITPAISKQSETRPPEDLPEKTVKLGHVHQMKVDTQSRPDLPEQDTAQTTSVYLVPPETQTRTELLDGRKNA